MTARRTEENLQKTPVAVTALGAEALRQSQVLNVSDLQRSTPSLVIATGAPSASGFTFVSLRGQGNLQATVSNDPAVAIYVDGVYIPRPSQGLTDLIDLERVEVLRGPQGTLFGRNTPGGAVQIITAGPTQVFEGNVRAEVGNFGTYAGGLTLNVPINDQLAARFVYNGRRHDGYGFDVPLNRDIWDQKSDFFRGKVRYDAGDWDITLTGDYNKLRDNGQFTALKSFAPELFGPGGSFAPFGLFNTLTNSLHTKQNWYTTYATGFAIPVGPVFATLPADVQAVYRRPLGNTLEAYGGSATINGDLGGVHLKSITGYRFSDAQGTVDSDGTPIPILTTWSGYRSKQWSQEFQISGEMGDRFNYIAGVYYSRETGTEFARSQSFGFIPNGGLINQSQLADIKNISKGVFGQGYYKLTDTVRLTGGLRWTWDNRDSVLHSLAILGVPTSCSLTKPDVAGVCAQTQKASFNYPAWTVGVDWQVNDEVFLYAQTRGAAKSGGWNTRQGSLPSFRPAKAKDVELGAKGTFLDNRLRTNFALFYQWQKDVQRNAAALTASGAPTQFVVNAGDARVWGMEFEGSVIPWEGMTVSGSVSLLDGEYKKGSFREPQTVPIPNVPGCIPSPGAAAAVSSICSVDRSREKLPQLPKVQYSIGATQHVPVSIGDLVLHADYSFVGAQSFNPVTVSLLRPAVTQALFAAENRLTRLNHYGLLNARVSLLLENPNIELSVFAKNLTQKKYASRVFSDVYSAGIGMAVEFDGEPRTYGVAATYRFGGGS
ncbi:MAG: TonB-dependent receptor [Phenylobacterium sp.]|nr:TonB-dependent receptor [Phenylobacterium sp.]